MGLLEPAVLHALASQALRFLTEELCMSDTAIGRELEEVKRTKQLFPIFSLSTSLFYVVQEFETASFSPYNCVEHNTYCKSRLAKILRQISRSFSSWRPCHGGAQSTA